MNIDENMIFEFKTKTSKNKEGVFIGFDKIEFKHIWKIMKVMIKNKIPKEYWGKTLSFLSADKTLFIKSYCL